MSICSDDLMGLAEDLLVSGTEASDRSAVSRSYYALLHEASDRSKAMGLTAGTGSGSHANVISGYRTAGGRLSCIGREIQKRKIMRNVADYDIHLLVDGPEAPAARKALLEATRILRDEGKEGMSVEEEAAISQRANLLYRSALAFDWSLPVPYSKEAVAELLLNNPGLANDVERLASDRARFFAPELKAS